MSEQQPTRVPFTGSCHCGGTQYVLFLTLPHPYSETLPPPPSGVQRFYRCNCTTCHKRGHFHIRPLSPTDDFLLLSPLDPLEQLGDYQCGEKRLHFLSCKTCAVGLFIFEGEGEVVELDLEELGVHGRGERGTKTQLWRPKKGGGHPELGNYVSVNGHTVDANQDGFDMRELTEKNFVMYCDCFGDETPPRYGKPQVHGCY
ncbi:hypothetical protein VFPPC_11748 [Pochonia chlamydosporia 170]|uniref:CENP-V/GFA domain-containing protein n=1 Tax=Pochonia chlamydosporia 170 TaxID=1380566 RepID=A0A179EYM0_METCM|nr:hypothetical protein VFPPC_11748 [Pochonia chlamydosporia 170]OAQ57999.1 hypothetical protein VFPPC_11748 [Pochonia chlamydosporia 170]